MEYSARDENILLLIGAVLEAGQEEQGGMARAASRVNTIGPDRQTLGGRRSTDKVIVTK